MLYVAVDIGCIECEAKTHVLGVFTSKQKAEAVCAEHKKRYDNSKWNGEHEFQVFWVGGIDDEIKVEYE